jgi:hypothetical protein
MVDEEKTSAPLDDEENYLDFALAHAEFDEKEYRDAETVRMAGLDENWKYYDGEHKKHIKVEFEENAIDDNVIINLCATLVDRTNSRLFGDPIRGEMLTFDIESKDEVKEGKIALHEQGPGEEPSKADDEKEREAQAFLQDIWDRSGGLNAVYNDVGVFGAVTGHFAFKIMVEEEGPRAVVLDPKFLNVLTVPDDKAKIRAYKIEYKTMARDPKDNRIKNSRFRQVVLHGVYFGLDDTWYAQDFMNFNRMDATQKPEWIPWSEVDAWDYCPIVEGQNLPHARDFWGMSDLQNVKSLNDEVNFLMSNVNRIVRYHSHPRTIGIGVEPDTIQETSVESFWAIPTTPDQAKIFNLEMESNLEAVYDFFDIIREAFWTIGREADPAVFKEKIGNVTNFGLRVLYLDALNKLGQKRQTYGKAFQTLGEKLLGLAESDYEKLTIVPQWNDPLPSDPRELVETMMMEMDMGILSKETAAIARGRNWNEEQKRLKKDEEEAGLGQKFLQMLKGQRDGVEGGPTEPSAPKTGDFSATSS